MIDTMDAMPGYGLAAVQIGVPLAAGGGGLLGRARAGGADGQPRSAARLGQFREHEEAIPNLPGVSAVIRRPRAVTVRFLNAEGAMEDRDFVNLWATSVQHQIDHLAGKMYFDHLSPLKRKMLIAKAEKLAARGNENCFHGNAGLFGSGAGGAGSKRHEIVAVYCQPPRPAGRGKADRPSPVQARAEALGLPVRHPVSLRSAEAQAGLCGAGGRCGRRGGLWADPAAGGAGCAAAWLPEHPRLACCRAGAGRRRSTARSWRAMRKPASASCRWRRGWTPGRCCCARRRRSAPRRRRPTCMTGCPRWARG